MKKQFVTYPIALALKELGFDEPCILGLSTLGVSRHKFTSPMTDDDYIRWDKYDTDLPIPLWQQVEEWFRENHSLFINVLGDGLNGTLKGLYYSITEEGWINWYESVDDSKWYDTYEEAREAAILEAIKIVKGEKNG